MIQPDQYPDRVIHFNKKHEAIRIRANQYSWLRTIAFLVLSYMIYSSVSAGNLAWYIITIVGLIGFSVLITTHNRLKYQRDLNETLALINQEEIDRQNLDINQFDPGEGYIDENHPYTADLDIFGKHSLFQLLNRCEIEDSKSLLAKWLRSPAQEDEIDQRQESTQELTSHLDWRQQFSAALRLKVRLRKANDPYVGSKDLVNWGMSVTNRSFGSHRIIAIGLISLLLGLSAAVVAGLLPYQTLYAPLLVNMSFLGTTLKSFNRAIEGIDKAQVAIGSYEEAIHQILDLKAKSDLIISLQHQLMGESEASRAITQLRKLTHRISARSNMLYVLADAIFMLDLFLLYDLLKWKRTYGKHLSEWLQTVHQFECMVSLAGFAHANPSYVFPKISSQPYHLEATQLGHPLIPENEKVKNDYQIIRKGAVDILTGSNMSGKSTFQRTVGVNMVLAQMGGPVNADKLVLSIAQVFTSMRTKDNLEENTSSFYAELKRIRELLDHAEKPDSTFFLVDEILKGTNSEDRHLGAVSLTTKLSQLNAFGIISTHDLALGKVANENPHIRNFSFNSTIEGHEIRFDYKLTSGICKSFNASQLMKNMGIMDQ